MSAARREARVKVVAGALQVVYSDDLAGLLAKGQATTTRASMVEPDARGGWSADMSLSGAPGVMLGPFDLRQQALDAEVAWLREKFGV